MEESVQGNKISDVRVYVRLDLKEGSCFSISFVPSPLSAFFTCREKKLAEVEPGDEATALCNWDHA